jgi:hypothetical protein
VPEAQKSGIEVIGKMVDDAAKKQAPTPSSEEAAPEGTSSFYVYTDERGTQHIVDALELVPQKLRAGAKKWVMGDGESPVAEIGTKIGAALGQTAAVALPAPSVTSEGMHVPSALLGASSASVLFLAAVAWRTRARSFVKLGIGALAVLIASGAYLGWVRREVGLSAEIVTTPSAVVESARDAAGKLEHRLQSDKQMLEKIDQEVAGEGRKR